MYGGLYDTAPSASIGMGLVGIIWIVVSLIVAFVGCFVVYFMFVANDKFKTNNKFVTWLIDFLRFDKMVIEIILKIAYIFAAIFITLGSFALIGSSFLSFLATIIGGNILIRVAYEAALIKVMIWKNTTEIKKNLK